MFLAMYLAVSHQVSVDHTKEGQTENIQSWLNSEDHTANCKVKNDGKKFVGKKKSRQVESGRKKWRGEQEKSLMSMHIITIKQSIVIS